MQPLVQIAMPFPVVLGYIRTPWSRAGGSRNGEVAEPGENPPARDGEEVGGLDLQLGIWFLSKG